MNILKKQILELFAEDYNKNSGLTYIGYSSEQKYKIIAHDFADLLMDIYNLTKNFEEKKEQ